MEKFFLAMMVSAVLLLIVAADLLVNGPGRLQEPATNVARIAPSSGRLVRCQDGSSGERDIAPRDQMTNPAEHFSPIRTSAHRVSQKGQRDSDRLSSALVGGS
jgi:hypothetical protein